MRLPVPSEARLKQALQMAVTDIEDSHAPDPFRFADYDIAQPGFLRRLRASLRRGILVPSVPLDLSFPKSEFSSRPGKRLELEDLVILTYLAVEIARDLEDSIRAGVTAYRVRKRSATSVPEVVQRSTMILPRYLRRRYRIIDPWYDAWPRFENRLRTEYKRGRTFLGMSDITSFYEDVDLEILRIILRDRVNKRTKPFANLLIEMLLSWSRRDVNLVRQTHGLPQGTLISGMISNYYLMPLDDDLHEHARRNDLRWFRYSDDLRILGSDRNKVRVALHRVGDQLSRLNLIQQGGKTRILDGAAARRELFDPRPSAVSNIIRQANRRLLPRARIRHITSLNRILETIRDPGSRSDSRVLAALYGAYRSLGSGRLLRRWRADLIAQPQRADTIMRYVSAFLNVRSRRDALTSFLINRVPVATDWEIAQLLSALRMAPQLPGGALPLLRSLAFTKRNNWYVRQQAILAIGWFLAGSEANRVAQLLETDWDDEVRRAGLTISFVFPPADELRILRRFSWDHSLKVARMAQFLLRLRTSPELALSHLKFFGEPNLKFFADGLWRLYQVRWNGDAQVRNRLQVVISRTTTLPNRMARQHVANLAVPNNVT